MDVKVTGSSPVYHPNANDKSDNKKTAKREEGEGETGGVKRKSTKEGGSTASIYKETKETKFSIKKSSESTIK